MDADIAWEYFDTFKNASLENAQLEEPNYGSESSVAAYKEAEISNRTEPNVQQQNPSSNSKATGERVGKDTCLKTLDGEGSSDVEGSNAAHQRDTDSDSSTTSIKECSEISTDDNLWCGKHSKSQKDKDLQASRMLIETVKMNKRQALDPNIARRHIFGTIVKQLRRKKLRLPRNEKLAI